MQQEKYERKNKARRSGPKFIEVGRFFTGSMSSLLCSLSYSSLAAIKFLEAFGDFRDEGRIAVAPVARVAHHGGEFAVVRRVAGFGGGAGELGFLPLHHAVERQNPLVGA